LTMQSRGEHDDGLDRLDHSLRDLIGSHVLQLPRLSRIPGGGGHLLQTLVERAYNRQATIGPATELLLSTFPLDMPWSALRSLIEDRRGGAAGDMLEVEELGLPFVESLLVREREPNRRLSTWKETQGVSKMVYICRLLSETRGNVAKASRESGLHRSAIYQVLREHKIDLGRFRRRRKRRSPSQ
jgi:hypothetical protein